ncbi:MAG: tetraprenyl-beta-curcumene synthase family protein [Firmicutes bacterium]|nr:tetraprenyl-beta-curcumene synthase family protein [Bacillota bacterium]
MSHKHSRETRWSAARLIRAMSLWVVPRVDRELARWRGALERCPDPELRRQGLSSIRHKRFHAIGGCVYSLDPRPSSGLVSLIVAYQTISDYLDNLCDRAGVDDGSAFARLHQSMLDAVTTAPPAGTTGPLDGPDADDYYGLYPRKADGGYLGSLVDECRRQVARLPAYHAAIEAKVLRLARLYTDLQVRKHVRTENRVPVLVEWWRREGGATGEEGEGGGLSDLAWWEFAAASGSTLAIFALFNLAAHGGPGPSPEAVERLSRAYFPWVCGVHILLDYLIDQEEDAREGDLNLVSFYRDARERRERLGYFVDRALESTSRLARPAFHQGVVKGLLAMYLSDPKVTAGGLDGLAAFLLDKAGPDARSMWRACRFLRRVGLL